MNTIIISFKLGVLRTILLFDKLLQNELECLSFFFTNKYGRNLQREGLLPWHFLHTKNKYVCYKKYH